MDPLFHAMRAKIGMANAIIASAIIAKIIRAKNSIKPGFCGYVKLDKGSNLTKNILTKPNLSQVGSKITRDSTQVHYHYPKLDFILKF